MVVNGDQTITYTPNAEFYGEDTISYEVSDGDGGVDSAVVNVNVTGTGMGVYDIWFDSNRRDRDWRAAVEVRNESGDAVVGATATVLFRGVTYIGQADSSGNYYTGWSMNVKSGTYYADIVDVALQDYFWDSDLDEEVDSDGDGLIDDVLYR